MSPPTATPNRPVTPVSTGRSSARRDQLVALALAAALLLIILFLQPTIDTMRNGRRAPGSGAVISQGLVPPTDTSLRELAVEFPRLTLGGFRGILAERLWYRAENAKNDRQWQDLGTYYTLIGKLEPYFVSVYKFNAWNEAYNLSAQWHSVENKYRWVLEGLNHLYDGEYYNPNNPDLLMEIAQMYFLKLGGSFERTSYRQFWRDNIADQYKTVASTLTKDEPHDLVHKFITMPQFRAELIVGGPPGYRKPGYGIRIRGLIPHQPDEPVDFRYGVSVFYFAYIEYQRTIAAGKPTIGNPALIDAYPAMSLRKWCMDDAYYATTGMRDLFLPSPDDNSPPLADLQTLDAQQKFNQKVADYFDCFRNIALIGPQAEAAFDKHLARYPANHNIHDKHKLETRYVEATALAEKTLFLALVTWQQHGRRPGDAQVAEQLQLALPLYDTAIAREAAFLDCAFPIRPDGRPNPDRADYEKYSAAMRQRQEGIKAWLRLRGDAAPDLSFLKPETIER